MEKVSVIIPVYNRSPELSRALKSVQEQTYQNYEVIIVDDHSTMDVASAIPCMPHRLLKTNGKGVSAARNTGLRAASSPLIAFLDSDDEWHPNKLQEQVDFLNQHPKIHLVHTNELWMRNGTLVKQLAKHKKSGGDIFINCTKLCVIAPSSVMLRKQLLDRVGSFDESFVVCEDFDLWLRITAQNTVGFLEAPLTIKHGGHSDQLSLQYHSMDLWRLRALAKHIESSLLTTLQKEAVKESILEKSAILLKGFQKHQNNEHLEEVQNYQKRCKA